MKEVKVGNDLRGKGVMVVDDLRGEGGEGSG